MNCIAAPVKGLPVFKFWEKAILKKQLDDLQNNSLVNRIKHLLPRQEKLICDYFRGR